MNDEEMRAAIAEACGWVYVQTNLVDFGATQPQKRWLLLGDWLCNRCGNKHTYPDPDDVWSTKQEMFCTGKCNRISTHSRQITRVIPDYLNDLNAMHEAEKTLVPFNPRTEAPPGSKWRAFIECLYEINDRDNTTFMHSTARQRAEAFVRTLGLSDIMNEFSNQAKDPRACDAYRALQKENETLRAEVERLRAREHVMREALTREMQFAAHMPGCAMLRRHSTLCTCGFARMRNASCAALAPDAPSALSNEVERLRKANAAMRSAISAVDLVLAGASTMPFSEARRILNESLVPGAALETSKPCSPTS